MYRFVTNRHYKHTDFMPIAKHTEAIQSDYLIIIPQFIVAITSIFFLAPVALLAFVQSMNFVHGRTTIERFGKSSVDNDYEARILNSGIKGDA